MATQNYEVTVNPNAITLDLTTQNNILTVQTVDYIMSLSRTGGQGAQGYSAYEIAVQNGYTGTAQQFAEELASIDEKSALAVASATAAANSATSATNSATASATSASNSSTSAGAASASANAAAQSAVTAAAQSNNSAQSAINAAASALEASNWADASEDSAIDSELSAADAAASEDAAASSEANALLYRNEAQTAATSAGASSTNANAQALAASLSAASAATSATNADNSEDNAASSATSALNSATSANTSANQAAISATTATTQATSATNSATNAAASQADALVSKNSASASASTATTKASEASNSAATASTKATEASASAAQAVLSATSASTSASTATLKAAEAAQSAADAAAAQAAAEASLASFRSTYLGELNADPTLDGNGDPVMIGAEYFNSVANKLKVYTSTGWQFYDATAQTASQNAALSASQAASSAATSQSYATTAINKAAEAATSANAADASADAALVSENAAESSEINASASENYAFNYKNAAATSADLASSYASASGVSATNAATSATTATTQATNSANSATASATSATNSANSALASANSATNAANSAASAATSATNAGVSEANADTSEANALASANTATTKAAEASTSATNAATSATNSAASATSSALSEGLATTAAATATTKASEASVSATSASGSAATASTKAAEATTAASSATTSAANAATSATNAANSASSATTSSASASTSATLAGNSANAAALSETNAATSASAANTYASNAATSASSADTSESNAEIYADNALASSIAAANTVTTVTGYANTASTKADEASASATSAANSATSAGASATTATTQATNASASATSASNSASSATASATVATNQATSAASSASTASTAASAASASATNAATSATNASNSANAAGVAKAAAEAARDQALAAFDNFDDKYLGEKESNPSLDNDGNTLTTGALYFNTTLQGMRVYTGTAWVAAYMSGDGYLLGSNNLSDLTNVGAARFNLGLGTSALANGYNLDGLTDVTITSVTNGQILEYESATSLWKNKTINALPAQATHNGQFLTTDGTNASWATVDALPPQATHADKFLRTDGTAAYWATVNLPTSAYTRTSFTATAGQTTFNVTYPLGSIQVYVNGVLLRTSDYTATNETSFTLNVPASAGAAVDAFVYNVYGIGQVLAQNIIGTVSIGSGGTGATTAAGARTNLGLGTAATTDSTAYATAAQGAKADTALQPATIGVSVQGYNANTVIDSAYVHTDNNYTTTEKSKLAGIAAGAEVNVNADWTSSSGDSQILNKPTLGTASAQNVGYFATAAQGTLADNAVSNITSNDGSVVISTTGTVKDLSVGIAGSTATLISQVRNETGATLTKGTVVYISGASGNKAVVSKALATGDSTSAQTYGMVQADIPNNSNGYVVVIGVVSGLNTLAFAEGVQLYLSPTTAGTYTNTKPYAPNHLVYVGVVTRSHANQGTIEVKIQNGYEMDELHDVSAQNPTNGDTLVYVSSTDLWTKTPQSSLSVASAAAVPFSGVTGKPTTLSGYGITDAYSSSNPSGYISGITSGMVTTALGYTPYNSTNPNGYISGITSSNVITALGYTPENAANKGNANGYASLDGSGLVPASQLPSYVDDVLEYANLASFPGTGTTGKIYVALDTNKTYRWSGSAYIYITSGAVDSVAGKTGVVTLNNSDVGLGSVENKSSATIRGEITSSNVTTALGYTPYNATNPSGYISGITSSNVTTALGYTPYNATNPSGYITSSALSPYLTSATAASTYFPLNGSGTLTGPYLDFNQSTVSLRITSGPGRFNIGDDDSVVLANAFRFYTGGTDGSAAFGDFRTNPATGNSIISAKTGGLYFNYDHGTGGVLFCNGATGVVGTVDASGNANFIGAITQNSNQVLHAGNFGSYALPLTGGTVSGLVRINNQLRVGQNTNGTAYIDAYDGYAWFGRDSNSTGIRIDASGNVNVTGALTQGGNQVLHAGNYTGFNSIIRALGYPSGSNDWNNLGNGYQNSIIQVDPSNFSSTTNGPTAASYTYGTLLNFAAMSSSQAQIFISHAGNDLIFRGGWNGTSWQTWNKVLTNVNYNSYSPTLTGSGASGTWGINVTGTASGENLGTVTARSGYTGSAVTLASGANHYQGHFYYDSYDAAGNHYPHFTDGGNASGVKVNWRLYTGGTNSVTHYWGTDTAQFATKLESTVRIDAPIFYDRNDTAYYINPNGSSQVSGSNFYFGSKGQIYDDGNFHIDGRNSPVWINSLNNDVIYLNSQTSGHTVMGNSARSPIFYDSNDTGYYLNPNGGSLFSSLAINGDFRTTFVSGSGGSTFGASHYSMGKDIANGGWSHPHYSDLIIGYHTGIRIGAHYSGIRFYNNSPTTDANNDGNGDAGEALLMTIGGYVGTANHSDVYVNNHLFAGQSMRSPIFYDNNDTNYYCNPNSFSQLSYANFNASPNGRTLSLGGDETDRIINDPARSSLVINATLYPHLYINATANASNTNHGPVFSMTGVLTAGGYRRWGMGIANTNPDCFSWGYYDNETNPHYGVGGTFGYTATNSKMWLNTGGSLWTTGDMRSPIFYDSNDTAYYVDPNSSGTCFRGYGTVDSRVGFVSNGNPWGTANSAYFPNGITTAGGTNWVYGSTYIGNAPSNGSGHEFSADGTMRSTGSHRASIYYDDSNTSYYVDPNGMSSMFGVAIRGDNDSTGTSNQLFLWGAGNTTTSSIGFKASGGAFPNPTGNGDGYNTYFTMDSNGRGWVFRRGVGGSDFSSSFTSGWITNNGTWQSNGSMRAPIFYDSDDTARYVDPNSESRLSTLRLSGARLIINGGDPTIQFVDSDQRGAALHNNSNLFYILSSNGVGGESWTTNNGYWPFYIDLNSNDSTFGGSIWAAGNITAYSDLKLKENIQTIDSALEKVLKLRGVYYTLKRDETKTRKVGVVAQEIQEVLPEVVVLHKDIEDEEGTLAVDYGNISGLLIEGMKEQNQEVVNLRKQLQQQQSELDELKSLVKSLLANR